MKLINAIKEVSENTLIIAEDLGYIDDDVINLLAETGFPGMKVLQFAFDSRENSDYLPHNFNKNCVVYVGTHDNDSIRGWLENAPSGDVEFAEKYLRLNETEGKCRGFIKAAFASVGETAILTMQDLLCLGSEARMNTPSTAENNWQWRALKSDINFELANELAELTELYKRC
jgi:4-alpha-glucanotransferase